MGAIPESLLWHRCTIERPTEGEVDALGEPTETMEEVATDVKCAFDDAGTEIIRQNLAVETQSPKLFLKHDQDVRELDQIKDITLNGATIAAGPYKVIGISAPGPGDSHLELDLEQVRTI